MIYVTVAQREAAGHVQMILGFIWIAMLLLSGELFMADVEHPFLLVMAEFLIHLGLFGTSLSYPNIMLKTIPEPYIKYNGFRCKGKK